MSEARAKPLPPVEPEGARQLPATKPPPPPPRPESDPFGSLADIGELPVGDAARVREDRGAPSQPPSSHERARAREDRGAQSQPPSSHERSRPRINACVAEEVVAPSRKDYRRE